MKAVLINYVKKLKNLATNEKLSQLRSDKDQISSEDKSRIEKEYDTNFKLWRTRKKLVSWFGPMRTFGILVSLTKTKVQWDLQDGDWAFTGQIKWFQGIHWRSMTVRGLRLYDNNLFLPFLGWARYRGRSYPYRVNACGMKPLVNIFGWTHKFVNSSSL